MKTILLSIFLLTPSAVALDVHTSINGSAITPASIVLPSGTKINSPSGHNVFVNETTFQSSGTFQNAVLATTGTFTATGVALQVPNGRMSVGLAAGTVPSASMQVMTVGASATPLIICRGDSTHCATFNMTGDAVNDMLQIITNTGGHILMAAASTATFVGVGAVRPATKLHMSSGTLTIDGNITPAINIINGALRPQILTSAGINALTPAVGDVYVCSNCANTYTLCVGTGAVVAGFREVGTATGCR